MTADLREHEQSDSVPASAAQAAHDWRVSNGMAGGLTAALLWFHSYPGVHVLLVVIWLLALASAAHWALRMLRTTSALVRLRVRLLVPALICMVGVALATTAPVALRFALSENSFESVILRPVPTVESDLVEPVSAYGRHGLYNVDRAFRFSRDTVFYVNAGAVFGSAGFAHLPDGPSDELKWQMPEGAAFVHLTGDWYRFTTSF